MVGVTYYAAMSCVGVFDCLEAQQARRSSTRVIALTPVTAALLLVLAAAASACSPA